MPNKEIDKKIVKELKTDSNQATTDKPNFEQEQTTEKSAEKLTSGIEKELSAEKHQSSFKISQLLKTKKTVIPSSRDVMTERIEKILADGLNDPYQRLSPIARQEFKLKGEQIAIQIRQLLKKTHIKLKKILKLILDWLRLLPGLNRFFLEQEAKIKAEKILELKEK